MQRGLECLKRFAQLINGMPDGAVRIVGTNALREARNRNEFIQRAEAILGHPVEVISGREEARLIYLGVSHTLADTPASAWSPTSAAAAPSSSSANASNRCCARACRWAA